MFIVPYILEPYHTSKSEFKIWITWIFMANGGKTVWETDEKDIGPEEVLKVYLKGNNLFGTLTACTQNVMLYEIDTKKTKFADFYNWNDILSGKLAASTDTEVWRPWMWIGESRFGEKDTWGWKDEVEEISLGKFGSVNRLWKLLRETIEG